MTCHRIHYRYTGHEAIATLYIYEDEAARDDEVDDWVVCRGVNRAEAQRLARAGAVLGGSPHAASMLRCPSP